MNRYRNGSFAGTTVTVFKIITLSNIMAIKINDAASRSEPGDNSDLADRPEHSRHDEIDGIDWANAAPGWVPLFAGLVLPLFGFVLLVGSIDLALSWLVERWGNPSGMSQLLRVAIMLPPALILAFGCCKLFLHLKDAKNAKARAGKRRRHDMSRSDGCVS